MLQGGGHRVRKQCPYYDYPRLAVSRSCNHLNRLCVRPGSDRHYTREFFGSSWVFCYCTVSCVFFARSWLSIYWAEVGEI